jgi:biotin operon repressor
MRHAVLQELADGSFPSVMVLAKKLDCHPDMMGRHLQRLKKAGLVIRVNPGEQADQRSKYYQIPAEFRSTLPDGTRVLDFGKVVLRFESL